MNQILLLILSIIGLLALYWALIGQWKWNKIVRGENAKNEEIQDSKQQVKKQDK